MATVYPAQIDNTTTLPTVTDGVNGINGAVINRLRDAILAIEDELGEKPSGIYTTVKNRLDALEAVIESGGIVPGGDLAGSLSSQIVVGFQGRPVSNAAPSVNNVYLWNGTQWVPGAVNSFTASGDLSGTNTSQTVIKINGASVPVSGSLTTGNVLQVSGAAALSYSALNLAGGSNFVTGVLPVLNGGSPWKTLYISAFSVTSNTNSNTYVNAGNFELDTTKLQSAGTGTRTIKLKLIAETTGLQANFQLFNVTSNSVVTGSTLTTTSTTPVTLTTGDLTSALTNGNAIYQVQMFMGVGGGNADRIVLDSARLQIDWS